MNQKILLLLCIICYFASCKVSKQKAPAASKTVSVPNAKMQEQKESILFFDAENARLIGDNKLAVKLYTDFVQKYPNNATGHYNLARLQYKKQDINLAIKNAEFATKLEPDNKYFKELYTQLLVYNNNTKQAETQYNELIKNNPQNDEYLYKKAMLFVKEKQYEKAVETLNDLEKKTGYNEDLILQKKNLYQRMGKTNEAITELQKLRKSEPNAVQYVIMMADVYETGKNKEKANEIYQDLEKNFPDEPLTQVALAQYYLENKDSQKHNEYMQKVMKNKNLDVETKIALIVPSLQKLENDSSNEKSHIIEMAKSIAVESPDNKEAVSLYADVLYFNKQYDEALIEYKKYLTLDKAKFNVWNQIISIYIDKQAYDSVIHYGNKSLEYFPNNPLPYFFVGVSYIQKKEIEKAISALNKSVDLEPENPALLAQLFSTLGDAYNTQKKYELSDSCFEKALKVEPTDATTLNNYAYYLSIRKEKLELAEKMSKQSLDIQPNSKSFLDTYGWIFFQQGKYEKAKEYIEKAIKAGGEDDGTLYDHLGDVYYKLNDINKAVENWNVAKQKGEDTKILNKKLNDKKWYEE